MEDLFTAMKILGPMTVLVVFFVWQGSKREKRQDTKFDELDTFNREKLLVIAEKSAKATERGSKAIEENTKVIQTNTKALIKSSNTLEECQKLIDDGV
jgi:hypothetical protein